MPEQCSIHTQGRAIETAPGITVRKVGGQCPREADWVAHWVDTVVDDRPAKEQNKSGFRQVEMSTPICMVHRMRLARGVDPLVDSRGTTVSATYTRIPEGETT